MCQNGHKKFEKEFETVKFHLGVINKELQKKLEPEGKIVSVASTQAQTAVFVNLSAFDSSRPGSSLATGLLLNALILRKCSSFDGSPSSFELFGSFIGILSDQFSCAFCPIYIFI